jgi:Divergent InlB B-repeat domain
VSFSVTVSKAGTDTSRSGLVTSTPAGINCGSVCTASFSSGARVVPTARTQGNRIFAGWSGACSGTATTCTLTMDANKPVTAIFNRR